MAGVLLRSARRSSAQVAKAYAVLSARQFASAAEQQSSSKLPTILGIAVLGGIGVYGADRLGYIDLQSTKNRMAVPPSTAPKREEKDYGAVRKAIVDVLDKDDHDDGSYGPVLVRLAWHASGTFDKNDGTGGSNGATMRFNPESDHGANSGLKIARDLLEPIKQKYPWITYADLWTLAGATAIEEMGGPHIKWRPGRADKFEKDCTPDGRLPDADKGASHVRDIFYRMGFDDQEIVALSGAHTLGRCHTDRSGYWGPWTNAPTTFSNLYYQELLNNKWRKKKWKGPLQYEDPTGELMMLPTDMALVWDKKFKPYVEEYAKNDEKFYSDFAAAFAKLLELGVPFPEGSVPL